MAPLFGPAVPLVYRVFILAGSGILAWATNLHVLSSLGIDTAFVLNIRSYANPTASPTASHQPLSPIRLTPSNMNSYAHPATLYPPIYKIFASYSCCVTISWLIFRYVSGGDLLLMDNYKVIPGATAALFFLVLLCPWNVFQKRERMVFLQSIRRCFLSPLHERVHFSDIVLADIFTSFAKIIADIWIAGRMFTTRGSLSVIPVDTGLLEWVVPCLMSLPYLARWRQCTAEYIYSNRQMTRSLYNAIKYATAFPVIFLSAAQRLVTSELSPTKSTWHGEHPLFRLWLLAVLINSLYSFWWDVTNDWGLEMLRPSGWPHAPPDLPPPISPTETTHPIKTTRVHRRSQSHAINSIPPSIPSLPPQPLFQLSQQTHQHPAGLRSPLLFRDPMIYYLAIGFNFILRFTWSLRLSSHLHTLAQLESGIFLMEALELIRRWVWVYFRIEWEAVRKGTSLDEIELRFRVTEEGRPPNDL